MPFRFETGTPNIEGVLGLGSAIRFVQELGWSKIEAHKKDLTQKALLALSEFPGLEMLGQATQRAPIFSFNLKGCHSSDVAQILDEQNIAVRSGHHCTQPLLRKFGLTGTLRASFSIYNDETHLQALLDGLKKAQELLK
jgi:cysteine desulfurase/selenocysteine lyase